MAEIVRNIPKYNCCFTTSSTVTWTVSVKGSYNPTKVYSQNFNFFVTNISHVLYFLTCMEVM